MVNQATGVKVYGLAVIDFHDRVQSSSLARNHTPTANNPSIDTPRTSKVHRRVDEAFEITQLLEAHTDSMNNHTEFSCREEQGLDP